MFLSFTTSEVHSTASHHHRLPPPPEAAHSKQLAPLLRQFPPIHPSLRSGQPIPSALAWPLPSRITFEDGGREATLISPGDHIRIPRTNDIQMCRGSVQKGKSPCRRPMQEKRDERSPFPSGKSGWVRSLSPDAQNRQSPVPLGHASRSQGCVHHAATR